MDFLPTSYSYNSKFQTLPNNPHAQKIKVKDTMGELKRIGDELTSTSNFRNISYSLARKKKKARTRDSIYEERDEMFNDKSVREMVKLIIKRSNSTPYYFRLPIVTELSDNFVKLIEEDFKYIQDLIRPTLLEVTIESQFLGDSYVALEPVRGQGVTRIIHNYSTKAYNVTPIISNKEREIAFEIADGTGRYESMNKKRAEQFMSENRRYIEPHLVARMNAKSSGKREPTVNAIMNGDNVNAWDKEKAYEDWIYGGVVEDCIESYRRFIWALNSIANARSGSAYIERFIMMHLQDTSESERTILRNAMNSNMETVRRKVSAKVQNQDPTLSVFNYVIPTTGSEAKGSIDIQESSPSMEAVKNLEDISIHIKKFMADLGYNIQLTPYSEEGQEGGLEQEGFAQKSLIMESTGEQIRSSVEDYVLKIFNIHTLYKYGVVIKNVYLEFAGVIEMARQQDEFNRLEAINNGQNFWAFIADLKASAFDDTPDMREMLIDQIAPKMEKHTTGKNKSLLAIVDHILKPEPIEEPQL